MAQFNTRQLVTVNLKYGTSAKPLKTLAFAQLVAKVLYVLKSSQEVTTINLECAEMIGRKNLPEELVVEGLKYLSETGKAVINDKDKKWSLRNDARKEISKEIDSERVSLRELLGRHFPAALYDSEKKELKTWFREASADFFGHYCEEWIKASSKGNKKLRTSPITIETLLSPSIKKNKLEQYNRELIDGFINFVSSDNVADQRYLWLISQAMFSARLVTSDIGVDPITIEELKDSTFILDTNVLFSLSLESSKLWKSIKALEEAFRFLNSKLIFLHITKEEHLRVLMAKRETVLHTASAFNDEVIEDVKDDFINTARDRGCRDEEAYNRFFDSLKTIPKALPNGLKIELEDNQELLEVQDKAQQDEKLKGQIQKFAEKFRAKWNGKKGEAALNHDASLLYAVDYAREKGEKCWILSLDKSLQAFVVEQTSPYSLPKLLSVPVLIEILALNHSAPILDAVNFAPLLSKLMLNECLPSADTYILQDLQLLQRINEKAATLPSDEVKKIVREISKARLEGRTNDVSLPLRINRMYEESSAQVSVKLMDTIDKVKRAEEDIIQEKSKREEKENELNILKSAEFKRKAKNKLIFKVVIFALIGVAAWFLVPKLYCNFFSCNEKSEILNGVAAVITIILFLVIPFQSSWNSYKEECSKINN